MSKHSFCFSYKIPVYFKGVFHNDFKETSKYSFDEISIVAVQIIENQPSTHSACQLSIFDQRRSEIANSEAIANA